jgi:hypothetical protein
VQNGVFALFPLHCFLALFLGTVSWHCFGTVLALLLALLLATIYEAGGPATTDWVAPINRRGDFPLSGKDGYEGERPSNNRV